MKDKPTRPSMSKARRARIWEKEKGICYLCGKKVLATEKWDAEHELAWNLSFDDSDENLRVAHKEGCHAEKTAKDVKIIAKAKRQGGEKGQWARRQANGSRIPSRPFQKPKEKQPWPKRPNAWRRPE